MFLFMHTYHIHNRGSSVGIEIRLRNTEKRNRGWILFKGERPVSLAMCHTAAGGHVA
jgi:hypothetical protein